MIVPGSANSLLLAGGGYQISRSVRLRSSASAYFTRTPASSSGQQTFTISAWVKRGVISAQQVIVGINSASTNIFTLAFLSGDTLRVFGRNAGSDVLNLTTTAVYRDPSAWYHIVIAIDTTQATSSNRARMYVNGVEVTAFGTATYPAQNTSLAWNSNSYAHDIGRESTGNYLDGYLTEINHISGTQLTPSSFGENNAITGVWQPKKYTGTYGTNGFYLNFSDNSAATAAAIGKDYSGNGNNWTPNNISVTAGVTYDSMLDVPTPYPDGGNGRGNYCVLNTVAPNPSTTSSTCTDGNLTASASAANTMRKATMSITSGAYYFEATVGSTIQGFGLGEAAVNSFGTNSSTSGARTYYLYNASSNLYTILPGADTSITTTVGSNGTLAVAVDMTNKKLWLGYAASGGGSITWIGGGSPASGTTPTYTLTTETELFPLALTNGPSLYVNFGQRPFTYTPPTGFKALNTQNLPTPTIANGAKYMAATLYTGNGSTQNIANTVNGVSFSPDLVWLKIRSAVGSHRLLDTIRGATKALASDLTNAEFTDPTGLTAFNSNGFSLGSDGSYNGNTSTYVGWQWQAGAGTTSSNTSGTITATVSVGATQGFSVVTYTGTGANATVGHGLGVAPSMIIAKHRNAIDNWIVYHTSLGGSPNYVWLNLTSAAGTSATVWNTAPTSSVFGVGTDNLTNASGGTYVAYCFAAVKGFSAFGSYTGNASANGPFIYTGFRPRYILLKNSSAIANWIVEDTSRSTYNVTANALYPNLANAEDTSYPIDILSNGFKIRSTDAGDNGNGNTIIYAAFAENPFNISLAR